LYAIGVQDGHGCPLTDAETGWRDGHQIGKQNPGKGKGHGRKGHRLEGAGQNVERQRIQCRKHTAGKKVDRHIALAQSRKCCR